VVGVSEDEIRHQLQQMDPYEFEELVANIWELQGYETTVRKQSGDRGIDVEAIKQTPVPQKILIQVKRYTDGNNVGAEEVRKYATLYQQIPDADSIVIVTSSEFTPEGIRVGKEQNVKTGDVYSIVELIIQDFNEYDYFSSENSKGLDIQTDNNLHNRNKQREVVRKELQRALYSSGFLAHRGDAHFIWNSPGSGENYKLAIKYFDDGWFSNKGCMSRLIFKPEVNTEVFQNINNIEKISNGLNSTRLRTTRESEEDVELELNIIRDILYKTGSDFRNINIKNSGNH
jgi:uncharacterized protein YvpB